jgi:nucleoside-diphosphate-sugar epimerase
VKDVARANLLACERSTGAGQVFNVASGKSTSLLQLVDTLNSLSGTQLAPLFEPERAGDIRHNRGDGAKIASCLGFKADARLAEGLRQPVGLKAFRHVR